MVHPLLPRRRTLARFLAGLGALLLLYTVAGFVGVPAAIEWLAERLAPQKLGRELALGSVEFNPYSLVLEVRAAKLMEPGSGERFASFDALTVDLSWQSLARLAPVVQELRLNRPYVRLAREADGRLNVDDLPARFASAPSSSGPARFSLNNIQVEDGHIDFSDKQAGTVHAVADLKLSVPFLSSLPADVDIFVEPLLSARVDDSPVLLQGRARPFAGDKEAVLDLKLGAMDMTRYLAYLPLPARVKVAGARLEADLQASFRQPQGQAPALSLSGSAALKALRVQGPDGKPLLGFRELALQLRDAPVTGNRFQVAGLKLDGFQASLERGPDGQLNLQRLFGTVAPAGSEKPDGLLKAADADAAPSDTAPPDAAPYAAPFVLALERVEVRDATASYADAGAAQPLAARAEKFNLDLRQVMVDAGRRTVRIGQAASDSASLQLRLGAAGPAANMAQAQGTRASAAQPPRATARTDGAYLVEVGKLALENWSARLEDQGRAEPVALQLESVRLEMRDISSAPGKRSALELQAALGGGRLAVKGSAGFAPLHADLETSLDKVDLLPFQAYVSERANLRLTRASLSGGGRLLLEQDGPGDLKGGFKGNLALAEVAAQDKAGGSDFLRWKSLALAGIDLRLAPLALAVDDVVLSDFFARIIIDANGRINLQDIVRGAGEKGSAVPRPAGGQAIAAGADPAPPPASAAPAGAMPPISIRKLTFQGGRVRFTDNFIKPNYSASLNGFGGVVSGLSSDPASRARVDLHGEVNRAPLTVSGRINPLRGDLALDLAASVRGMELAALSAYSSRYVGYGIEKGKLSFEVKYQVEERQLSAANRLLLDQLTFGEKVDSPGAMDLPVRLAVALLQDRNGIIDINVPIGGSLDDPQFSLGGVIMKAVGNAIVKVVTQPFAMLASLVSGGPQDLGKLAFEPGRFAIPEGGEQRLRSLAGALAERPGLKLEITGWADPESDREGLKRAVLERKLRAVKAKQGGGRGGVAVSPEEYPALLAQAYREEEFSKPRQTQDLPGNLPLPEMERLMLDHIAVDEHDLAALGNRRAQAVKSWLQDSGKVDAARVFILAARTGSAPAAEAGGQPAGRVEFSLR